MDTNELLGRIVDRRYRINELIGSGGMGAVYRSTHLEMNREIALKVLGRGIADSEKQIHRFYQEARASSRLQHPNTIRVFDFGRTEDGRLYLAMEYLRGEPLTELLKREKKLDIARSCHIVRQVCKSLAEAHQNGIIHRDLKPDNIFITDIHGEQDFVKVLDFGIAKSSESEDMASLTQTGFICGTPRYLSPEQALGRPVDARSDLYSLGVILFEMYTGNPPFIAATPIALVMKHIHESAPAMENDGTQQGAWMQQLITHLLEKQPDGRPPSAPVVSEALRAIDRNEKPDIMGSSYSPTSPPRTSSTTAPANTLDFRPNRPISGHGVAAQAQASAVLSNNATVLLNSDDVIPSAASVANEPMARETFDQAVLNEPNDVESSPTIMVEQASLVTDPDGVDEPEDFSGGRTLALDTQPNTQESSPGQKAPAEEKPRVAKGRISSSVSVNLDEDNGSPYTQMIEVSSTDAEDEDLARRALHAGRGQNMVFGVGILLLLSTIGVWVWLGGQEPDWASNNESAETPAEVTDENTRKPAQVSTPKAIGDALKDETETGGPVERKHQHNGDRQQARTLETKSTEAPAKVEKKPEPKPAATTIVEKKTPAAEDVSKETKAVVTPAPEKETAESSWLGPDKPVEKVEPTPAKAAVKAKTEPAKAKKSAKTSAKQKSPSRKAQKAKAKKKPKAKKSTGAKKPKKFKKKPKPTFGLF